MSNDTAVGSVPVGMAYLRGMAVTRHFGHPQRTSPLRVVQAALTRRAVLYCPPPRKYAGYPVADDLLSMLRASEPTRETKLHTSPLRHLCGLRSSEKQTEHGSLGPCCSALSLSCAPPPHSHPPVCVGGSLCLDPPRPQPPLFTGLAKATLHQPALILATPMFSRPNEREVL